MQAGPDPQPTGASRRLKVVPGASVLGLQWVISVQEGDFMYLFVNFSSLDMNECCEFELTITGGKPGRVSHNLPCKIEHSPEPVVLHVEAAFKVSTSSVVLYD